MNRKSVYLVEKQGLHVLSAYIVTASVNALVNLETFELASDGFECKVIVVDEGDQSIRTRNSRILKGIPHEYVGPIEREEWFRKRFGSRYRKHASIIPERCHAETSFGFLVAYEEEPDLVIELDDDVFSVQKQNLIELHCRSISEDSGSTVKHDGKWYNTMENLELNGYLGVYPRGHPYSSETRSSKYIWRDSGGKSVLNMGLWVGTPDLDALTIIYHGGVVGKCPIRSEEGKRKKVIVDRNSYFAICSMNTAFLPEIIPAFYQLYMNFMSIDRFDDIWSGIFLKKVTDHLSQDISLGNPLVNHQKRPRDVFKDLEKELHGMAINEILWRIIDELDLNGKTYWDAYNSLTQGLEKNLVKTSNHMYQKFLRTQIEKMKVWLEITDKIK